MTGGSIGTISMDSTNTGLQAGVCAKIEISRFNGLLPRKKMRSREAV